MIHMLDKRTLRSLLNGDVRFCTELGGSYYIRLEPESDFDERIYKVNKLTGSVKSIHVADYLPLHKKAVEVDIKELRKKVRHE